MTKRKVAAKQMIKLIGHACENSLQVADVEVESRAKWPLRNTRNVHFRGVQFNSPLIGGRLSRPRFANCTFEDCNLDGINAWHTTFVDCEFYKSIVGQTLVGNFKSCTFTNCKFKSCRLCAITFLGCEIDTCRFANNRIRDVGFVECTIDRLTCVGNIKGVNFQNCQLRNSDLSKSSMDDVTLLSCNRINTQLPDSRNNFIVSTSVFTLAKEALASELSKEGLRVFCETTNALKGSDFYMSVSPTWLKGIADKEREIVLGVLYSLRDV